MDKAVLVWVTLAIIWGTTWIFINLGLRDLPPMTFAGIRFLTAWTGLIAFGLNYGLIFWGETRITSGLAAVLQAMI